MLARIAREEFGQRVDLAEGDRPGAIDLERRQGEVAFAAATTFTGGMPNPVFTFTIPS